MYDIGISLMAFFIRMVSSFHRKAKLMVNGHKKTFDILKQKIDPQAKYVWFHAASLGEFEQARPLIETIKKEYPQYKILLTFFSPSGYEIRKDYEPADVVCYLPFDTKKNAKKLLDLANPHIAIFVKYEFWYNYIHESYRRKIPVYLISSIFRPEQRFFKKNKGKLGSMLQFYKHIFVQDEASQQLLAEHGIHNVSVTGDTRMDRVIEIQKQAKSLPIIEEFTKNSKHVFIAGSSWPADEDIFIDYFNARDELKLIIAPHEIHESHLVEIERKLKRPNIRYSQIDEQDMENIDSILIDSFGLLSSIYRYGNIAYIGGGFGAGIHNLPEAAVYGIPVIFGPNHQKFREAHGLLAEGGGFAIKSKEAFFTLMDSFLADAEKMKTAGQKSAHYIFNNAGATQKIFEQLSL